MTLPGTRALTSGDIGCAYAASLTAAGGDMVQNHHRDGARVGEADLGGADGGGGVQGPDCRRRVSAASDHKDQRCQQPLPVQHRCAAVCKQLERLRLGGPQRCQTHRGQGRRTGPVTGRGNRPSLLGQKHP